MARFDIRRLLRNARSLSVPLRQKTTEGGCSSPKGWRSGPCSPRVLPDIRVRRSEVTGYESLAAREGQHDDLVLALAIALWWGCGLNRQQGGEYVVVKAVLCLTARPSAEGSASLLQLSGLRAVTRRDESNGAALAQIGTACGLRCVRVTNALVTDELDSRQEEVLREHVHNLPAGVIAKTPT